MEETVVLERSGPSLTALVRWSGMALVAGGGAMVVASLLHPSLETDTTIPQTEAKLVAAHVLYTLAYLLVLLGLPGLYGHEFVRMGWLGLAGFVVAFSGTALLAVSGNFGFIAPVLASESPGTIDAISRYGPVVVFNAVAAIGFMVGWVIFGIAMARAAILPRASGLLVAVGAPAHLIGFGLAQLVSPPLWPIAIAGSVALGAGLAGPGYHLWRGYEGGIR
jgi:hypothetical protein